MKLISLITASVRRKQAAVRCCIMIMTALSAFCRHTDAVTPIDGENIRHPAVTTLALSDDGSLLFTAARTNARVWDVARAKVLWEFDAHLRGPLHVHDKAFSSGISGAILYATFSPGSEELVTAGADGNIIVWDVGARKKRLVVGEPWIDDSPVTTSVDRLHRVPVSALAVDFDRKLIAIGLHNVIEIWNLDSGERTQRLGVPKITGMLPLVDTKLLGRDFQSDEQRIAAVETLLSLQHKSAAGVRLTHLTRCNVDNRSDLIHALSWTGDGRGLVAARVASIEFWNLRTGKIERVFDACSEFAMSPNGNQLGVGAWGQKYRVRDTQTGTEVSVLDTLATQATFFPAGQRLLVKGNRRMEIWDLKTRRRVEQFPEEWPNGGPDCYCLSGDGTTIAASWRIYDTSRIRIWSVR